MRWPWPRRAKLEAICEQALQVTRQWAREQGLPVYRIETVAAFERWSRHLGVWVFYESDAQRAQCAAEGRSAALHAQFLHALRDAGYPSRLLGQVSFAFDSHETVLRDYQGSYFLRLR